MTISAISFEQERKIIEAIAKELPPEISDYQRKQVARKIFNAMYDILRGG